MKKIVLCFDGTWNTPTDNDHDQDEISSDAETNVVKIYRSILGTDRVHLRNGSPPKKPKVQTIKWYEHVRGGAFGFGLSRNIREGYKFLIDNFSPGDDIYLFGFSRGAYTARSLVGLIRNSGLLKPELVTKKDPDDNPILMEGYHLYRNRDESADTPFAKLFRSKYSYEKIAIKFLGVWDTVGALGIPIKVAKLFSSEQYQFH
jgi:uncharacterized protein (DUF2235 family)